MPLKMWTYDIAREQSPSLDHLRLFCRVSQEAGFDALGLYLEHRFAYPSAPWAHGVGAVTPEMVRAIQSEFPGLRIVPFVNLLGHFEGMIYTEEGKRYREELFQGLQACPSNPDFLALCRRMLDDVIEIFDSELIHIGGDETWQLGACPLCKKRVEESAGDGKAEIYAAHFGPLSEQVLRAGRRPGLWGDMFRDHPTALDAIPKETQIFDWQYFGSCRETAAPFLKKGFSVVGCPALHTYNATWLHIPESENNVRQIAADAADLKLDGVCVTTWECGLFGAYDTLVPALKACGRILSEPSLHPPTSTTEAGKGEAFLAAYLGESERYEEWARLMGVELQECGGVFKFSGIRSALKCRLLLYSNPFLTWMHHAGELCGEVGGQALAVLERAFAVAPNDATRDVTLFARTAIDFVRLAEAARLDYAEGKAEAAIGKLGLTRKYFDDLERAALRTVDRIGGSKADVERCRSAKRHVEVVLQRIRQYGDGSLGYLPAFEIITHPKFVPHDQASWWLINRWANQ